eukprot:TRINITY_DN17029_c0_g1_i1.p1 TRINITY_DN17029_c0_g1~~TRINITY_DN17029_c0_g1_i1.p1  ORF type:complete len:658 (-),score=115.24 TRINITY_DN17029_c0_g1_i1:228-2201(-)
MCIRDRVSTQSTGAYISTMGLRTLAFLSLLPHALAGFYALPGVAPKSFEDGDHVDLDVARLDSVITQLPYPYYSLPYCQPETREFTEQHLGASLRGDRIEASSYELTYGLDQACRILCSRTYEPEKLKEFEIRVREGYRAYWLVDNLPAATRIQLESDNSDSPGYSYERGFDIGTTEFDKGEGGVFLNNHVRLTIRYHQREDKAGARIVAFEVEPFSVKHSIKKAITGPAVDGSTHLNTCKPIEPINHQMTPMRIDGATSPQNIVFTYDVSWVESDTRWSSRWDMYLLVTDDQVHWFSVFNSLITVIFLSGMVAVILLRVLNADITTYNEMDAEEGREETGWKLLHADVFRQPEHSNLLSAMVGTGCQLFCACTAMLVFASFGFVSPAHRGGLMTAMLISFVMTGVCSGYFSSRNYKMLGGTDWKTNTLWAAFLAPSLIFGMFFLLNLVLWSEGSSGAVPFGALCKMLFLFLGVHVPLCYAGGHFGSKRDRIMFPCKVNLLPRALPPKEWYMHPMLTLFLGGLLPFGAILVEVNFVLSSIWLRHYYYVFGFMLLAFVILTITCSEMCIVLCYSNLCHGDYEWWWRSFLTAGSTAVYVFLYSIWYYHTQLSITKTLSMFLYFGYNLMIAIVVFLLTGTIGYQATLIFVRKIFAAVKID